MRHVFIVNPVAGKNKAPLRLIPLIEAYFQEFPGDYCIRVTEKPGDTAAWSREEAEKGDAVRVYACGGDGTLLGVANGISGADNAELACVPCGSANDFIRFLPDRERFNNLAALIRGTARRVDAIQCNDSLSLNLCSMGMDADVAERMVSFKHLPGVSGPMAYKLAVAYTYFRPIGANLRVVMETEDGRVEREGKYLFALAANGQYYGGGYHGAPRADTTDGLLDFVLIRGLNHLTVLPFLSQYKRGQHLDMPYCEHFRGTRMEVFPDRPTVINADGECSRVPSVAFGILPQAFSFVYPEAEDELLRNYEISEKSS